MVCYPKERRKPSNKEKTAISTTWMEPEDIMLSEISQTEKDRHTV